MGSKVLSACLVSYEPRICMVFEMPFYAQYVGLFLLPDHFLEKYNLIGYKKHDKHLIMIENVGLKLLLDYNYD